MVKYVYIKNVWDLLKNNLFFNLSCMVSYAYIIDLILQIILLNHFWQMHNIIIKVAIISSFKLYR